LAENRFLITEMRTPAGKECRYFYGDYYRGRQHEECRLVDDDTSSPTWRPDLCRNCPVPGILISNACDHMILKATVSRPFPFFKRLVQVRAYCDKTHRDGFDPHVGCGECHPLPEIFTGDHP
jgi:hypothetical protein